MRIDKNKISIEITAEIGSIEMAFDNFIALDIGSKLKLKNINDEEISIYANKVLVGKGEFITNNSGKAAVILKNKY